VRIAAHASQRRRIHKVEVPLHQRGKGRLGFFRGIAPEQLDVVDHGA
jgi:hypothetical protein